MPRKKSARIWRNRIVALSMFLCGAILLLWAGLKVEALLNSQNDDLVREKLEEILNGEVRFLGLSGDITNNLIIRGIRLVEKTPASFLRFNADKLVFEYDLVGLVTRDMPLSRITLQGGMLKLNRSSDGIWDMDRMFRMHGRRGLYIPSIVISSSSVKIRDMAVREGNLTLDYEIFVNEGEVFQSKPGNLRANLRGYYGNEPSSRINFIYERIEVDQEASNIDQIWSVSGSGLPLDPFGAYIEGSSEISFTGGSFDFALTTEAKAGADKITHGHVEIRRGVVNYSSYAHSLEDVTGKIGFSSGGWALGGLRFRVGSVPFEVLRGGTTKKGLEELLDMRIRTLPTDLGDFFGLAGIKVEASGATELSLDMKGPKDQPEYYGEIRCDSGKVWGLDFSEGFILFSRHDSRMDVPRASLKSYGGTVTATGGAEIVGDRMPFRMDLDISSISLQDMCGSFPFLKSLGIKGEVEASIQLEGDLSNRELRATGEVNVSGATFMNLSWDRLSFSFSVRDGILNLGDVSLLEGDYSPLRCRGFSLDLGEKVPTYSIEIELSEIPISNYLKMVPESGKLNEMVGGIIEKGTLVLKGRGFSSLCDEASADLSLRDLAMGRTLFKRAHIEIGYTEGNFRVENSLLSSDYCDLSIAGGVDSSGVANLDFVASNVDLVKALDRLVPWIAGKVSPGAAVKISGNLKGKITEPELSTIMSVPSLDVAGKRITGLYLEARTAGDVLAVTDLHGSYQGFSINCSGSMGKGGNIDLRGEIDTFSLDRLTEIHPGLNFDHGNGRGSFIVQGDGKRLDLNLELGIKELRLRGLGPLSGTVRLSGELPPEKGTAISGTIIIDDDAGKIDISSDGESLRLKGSSISLSLLGVEGFEGTGSFDISGASGKGFRGSLLLDEFTSSWGSMKGMSTDIILGDDTLSLTNGKIPGAGKFFGSVNTKKRNIDLTFLIMTESSEKFFSLAGVRDVEFESISGKATVTGSVSSPVIRMSATGAKGRVFGLVLGKTVLDVSSDLSTVKIEKLESAIGDGTLNISGKILRADPSEINLIFNGRKISMSEIPGLTNVPGIRPDGKCEFSGWIRGTSEKPGFSITFDALNPLGGFTSVKGGVLYSDGMILIRDISFAYRDQELRVVGKIPWDLMKSMPSSRGEMEIRATMEKGELSAFMPENSLVRDIRGDVNLSLRVWGNSQEPKMEGRATVTRGSLKPVMLLRPIPVSDLEILFGEDGLEFKSVNSPGSISVTGTLGPRMSGDMAVGADAVAVLDLKIGLPNFQIRHPQGFDPAFSSSISVTGRVDTLLKVGGSLTRPEIEGSIELENSNLDFPLDGMGQLSFTGMKGLKAVIAVVLSKNCWYRNNLVSAELDGRMEFTFQNSGVALGGKVDILRGKINYLSNDFDIIEGHADFRSLSKAEQALEEPAVLDKFDLTSNFDIRGTLSPSLVRVMAPRHRIQLKRDEQGQTSSSSFALYVRSEARIRGIDVYLTVTGDNGDLKTSLYSDPPQDQSYIYSLLTKGEGLSVNSDAEGDSRDALNLVGTELTNTIWKQFSSTFARNMNLSEFTIKSSVLTNRSVQKPVIHLGKYLNDNLYFSYSRSFAENDIEVMGLEYRLRRKLILDTELKKDEDTKDLSLGLKFKRTF
ncbi:MAG: hypothetical protein CVV64_00950 [Candidatus Wallbacteria bacterium HGW-Wallbacteria-1]|jgi:hypothetical protein|uniref:Translocation and assembly module TamB C-terminal domain-containing protein n=1 Tax=Candidatus Wallbacteria bacterium HGW-Wallbacteria-1 TaxID=2013854 RepID=A0A2N1PUK1_9BACT|nr:MAG: hypothetical protein CVV64_00950 [Candidatus Wallbacteria bacterium HGW-Wallbacteria-1]